MDGFTDPEDGMFDVSHWLAEKKGFFPVPIIITEPAIGFGLGAALAFLHDPLAGRVPEGETFDPQSKDAEGKLVPPSISALFGMYTENDTWMAGGAHMGVWKNDNIRYTGALATGSININVYRTMLDREITINTNIEPDILYQDLKFRIKGSKFFAGASYLLLNTSSEFSVSGVDASFKNKTLSSVTQAGLVNNLNDGMIWGLLPMLLLTFAYDNEQIGVLTAIYPTVWGLGQLVTGKMSDHFPKKSMLVWGMLLQGLAILVIPFSRQFGILALLAGRVG